MNEGVRDGADAEGALAGTCGVHIECGSLHLHCQYTHLLPLLPTLGIVAVEDVAGKDVTHLVVDTQLLGLCCCRAQQLKVGDRGKCSW